MRGRVLLVGLLSACGTAPPTTIQKPPPAEPPPLDATVDAWMAIELPGARVEVPPSTITLDRRDSYDDGLVVVKARDRGPWHGTSIVWGIGGVLGDPVAEQASLHALIGSIGIPFELRGTRHVPVAGMESRTWELASTDLTLLYTLAACGRRSLVIGSIGTLPELNDLHARMVDSARCTPDAAREQLANLPNFTLTLPAGWAPVPSETRMRTWTRASAESINVLWAAEANARDPVPAMNSKISLGIQGPVVAVAPIGGNPAWEAHATDGTTRLLMLTVAPCGDRKVLAYYAGSDSRDGRALLATLRCSPD